MYQWCEFKSRRGKNNNLTALKSNSNTVWFNLQTYIYRPIYMYCYWRSSYQERRGVGIPLTGLTPPHVCVCPKPGPVFPMLYVMVFVCLVKMRCGCSFSWYWWNSWPSLFKLSFHNPLKMRNKIQQICINIPTGLMVLGDCIFFKDKTWNRCQNF